MEDRLVTLAILTFEKAQILKTLLETEGIIDAYIHNVNLIQPVVSAGVRVRIKESDLPHALRILEDSKWLNEKVEDESQEGKPKKILIPVDFSEYSMKACKIGINYAHSIQAEVMLMHAYFTPYFPSAIPMGDTITYQISDEDSIQYIVKRVKTDMGNICAQINRQMEAGELPHLRYDFVLREGLPEEEILSYSKEYHASLIIMGTRGSSQKDLDLIGSVTGEVIDANKVPVLAIPENIHYKDLSGVKNIAFATSFNQRDLVAFDRFMELFKNTEAEIHIFNVSTTENEWNEIQLTGISEYFKRQYPGKSISHTVLDDGDLLTAIENFVRAKNIDLIALSIRRRNVLARIFNPSIARRMLFCSDTPLLIMNS